MIVCFSPTRFATLLSKELGIPPLEAYMCVMEGMQSEEDQEVYVYQVNPSLSLSQYHMNAVYDYALNVYELLKEKVQFDAGVYPYTVRTTLNQILVTLTGKFGSVLKMAYGTGVSYGNNGKSLV